MNGVKTHTEIHKTQAIFIARGKKPTKCDTETLSVLRAPHWKSSEIDGLNGCRSVECPHQSDTSQYLSIPADL